MCMPAVNPPGGQCPQVCDGGCDDNTKTCTITCSSSGCDNQVVDCPADWNCDVECDSTTSCTNTTINCPEKYGCHVLCDSTSPCDDATINCGEGYCHVECTGTTPCEDATLNCGLADGLLECYQYTNIDPDPTAVPDQNSNCSCQTTGC